MRFRCNMSTCGTFPQGFEFEDNSGVCPKCNASGPPRVAALIDVHLMVMHAKGPIEGKLGRQMVACQPKREYLCRNQFEMFSASDDPTAVTCPKCLRTDAFRERAAIEELAMSGESPALVTVDLGASRDAPAAG